MKIPNQLRPIHDEQIISGSYLTVMLAGRPYGLPNHQVRDIIPLHTLSPVADLPEFVKWLIHVRGRGITILDLRVRFAAEATFTEETCLVVVQVEDASWPLRQVGLIVDAVDQAFEVPVEEVVLTPVVAATSGASLIDGVAIINGTATALLDIAATMAACEAVPSAA